MPDQYHLSCCYREQVTYMLYSTFREPKLFRLAVSGDWDDIPARCQSHPKEAAFVHKYAPNDTALHRVLRRGTHSYCLDSCANNTSAGTAAVAGTTMDSTTRASAGSEPQEPPSGPDQIKLRAVRALLEAHPSAAARGDSFGRTPLHLACMDASHCGVECARLLLPVVEENSLLQPASAVMCGKDVEGRTPLHWLLLRYNAVPLDVLDWMLRVAPAALKVTDAVRETPIDIVRRRRAAILNYDAVAKTLLQHAPTASLNASSASSAPSPRTSRTKVVGLQDLPPCSSSISKASAGATA